VYINFICAYYSKRYYYLIIINNLSNSMSLYINIKNSISSFFRNTYRKIIPKNIREKRWQYIYHKRQHKFYINFSKYFLKFTHYYQNLILYMDKNTEFLFDEEKDLIPLLKNNNLTITSLFKKWELIRLLRTGRRNSEQENIMKYLQKNPVAMLPYDYIKKYDYNNIVVYNDNSNKYIMHEDKRLYFPGSWENENIQKYYNGLIYEQDIDSPHRYESDIVHVSPGDVVVDIGASEGFFALSVIDKAKKIYLFECDEIWNKPQKMTFAPYKDKVVMVNKYVSDYTNDNNITMDQYFEKQKVNFIKMDIEGTELKALKGSHNIFTVNKDIKVAICTYHNKDDAKNIRKILLKNNFFIEFSKGYIISVWEESFNLRKGIIRGYKL